MSEWRSYITSVRAVLSLVNPLFFILVSVAVTVDI